MGDNIVFRVSDEVIFFNVGQSLVMILQKKKKEEEKGKEEKRGINKKRERMRIN